MPMGLLIEALNPVQPEGDDGITEYSFRITRSGDFDPALQYRVIVGISRPAQIDAYDLPSENSQTVFDPSLVNQDLGGGFANVAGVVQFTGTETEQIITVRIRGDHLVEPNEIIRLEIQGYDVFRGGVQIDNQPLKAGETPGLTAIAVILNDDTVDEHWPDPFHLRLAHANGEGVGFIKDLMFPPSADFIDQRNKGNAQEAVEDAAKDGEISPEEEGVIRDAFEGKGFDQQLDDLIGNAKKALDQAQKAPENAALHFIPTEDGEVSVAVGSAGLDAALMDYVVEIPEVLRGEDGLTTVFLENGQSLILVDMERVVFVNEVLALDVGAGETAGSVYRIYQAAFDRVPDTEGLGFWIDIADAGASLVSIAQAFVSSDEFQLLYGSNPTDEEYVGQLYENVLGREGEEEGLEYWTELLDEGAIDRAQMLAAFSESLENIQGTEAAIADGIWYV